MNFEQLRTFLVVARHGGIRRASEQIHISQPAVTARIRNLEKTLNVTLFDRSSSGMMITKRGEALLKYAEQYLQLGELIQRDVVDTGSADLRMRVGVSETIVQSWLPEFVSNMRCVYENLEIEISVDISINLRKALLARSLDLAILMGPVSEYSVNNVRLPEFPLCWYCASNADLSETPQELFRNTPVVTFARNTRPYRELKNELFNRYGPGISFFPSSSLSASLRLVAAGLGIAALPVDLENSHLGTESVRKFSLDWTPSPLSFTASYVGDPHSFLLENAAKIALETARQH
ncbi:LysR family transcriptional regulator [Chromatiales bacterium (ex Bugula neritina AB1)]|nr:LysR family transcriptional regulator [Chromatiales bacterium (ex Bugula neritina AB1)]